MAKSSLKWRYLNRIIFGIVILSFLIQFIVIRRLLSTEGYPGLFAAQSPPSHVAVIHNPLYSWRQRNFINTNLAILEYQLRWFSDSTDEVPFDCNLAKLVYKRCPTKGEVAHLTRHKHAWSWIASLPHPFGLVAEDISEFVSSIQLKAVLEQFQAEGLDIVGLYAPEKNIIQQDNVPQSGLIIRSDCIPASAAYVLSRRAARLLSAHRPPAGAVIDHICFLAREHGLRLGHVNEANVTLVQTRPDFSVLLDDRGWIKSDLRGFHCAPPPENPALPASIQLAESPIHSSFPDVHWTAPIQHRAFVNLENNLPSLRADPWLAEAGAVLSFQPAEGPADWFRLTYALGYEGQYRRAGRGWAERGGELPYWISHCVEERMGLLREINRHYPTLSLAACTADGSRRAPPGGFLGCAPDRDVRLGYNAEKHCAYARSRLALALENSPGEGYVTEKLWLPLLAGAVPVYHGAPDVAEWLPAPEAAIDLAAFPSVADGMMYARSVAADARLWARHTAWRARPFSLRFLHALRNSLPNLFCNLDPAVLNPRPTPPSPSS